MALSGLEKNSMAACKVLGFIGLPSMCIKYDTPVDLSSILLPPKLMIPIDRGGGVAIRGLASQNGPPRGNQSLTPTNPLIPSPCLFARSVTAPCDSNHSLFSI